MSIEKMRKLRPHICIRYHPSSPGERVSFSVHNVCEKANKTFAASKFFNGKLYCRWTPSYTDTHFCLLPLCVNKKFCLYHFRSTSNGRMYHTAIIFLFCYFRLLVSRSAVHCVSRTQHTAYFNVCALCMCYTSKVMSINAYQKLYCN